ncbi:MAG: ABC transporter permease subunit [Nevskia sp.]|nr:ABC transporter permease subunit [Nevskia sp.]
MRPLLACLLALLLSGGAAAAPAPLRVGSKNFTESIVLAEMARLQAQRDGLVLEHRRALGGSAILWAALQAGDIDAYPEYTGTLSQELMKELPPRATLDDIRRGLAERGLGASAPLGFDDRYALGVTAQTAQRLGLRRLSDLAAHADLRYAISNEFMDRGDGWRGLCAAYGLDPARARAIDHDLAYRALLSGAADVIDLYTTDAEIERYGLVALADDRDYFPGYQALWLYRQDALRRTPALGTVLDSLAGGVGTPAMRGLNAAVKFGGRSETQAAADFLGLAPGAGEGGRWRRIGLRTQEHLRLVGLSLGLALLTGLPLGVAAARRPRLGQALLAATSILQTVPSLAMFVFLIPWLGIGAAPAIAALFFYSLLPIVRNTVTGLTGIAPALRESAESLGLPPLVQLLRIELPLALPVILAGVSTAAVIDVGTATLGALIGAGGYGQPILTGIRLDSVPLILEGALPAAALALLVQGLFHALERAVARRGAGAKPPTRFN